jgi:signal peptidase II
MTAAAPMKKKYLWIGAIAAAVIVLDQVTKYLVMRHIPKYSVMHVIPGFFDVINVRNPGAAFGILNGAHGGWRVAFFIIVSLAALGLIAVLVRKTTDRLSVIAFSLISGGAVGNLIDRVRFGEVVDFIDWYYRSWHWPTFNIADSAITVGVGLLAIDMVFLQKNEPAKGEGKAG